MDLMVEVWGIAQLINPKDLEDEEDKEDSTIL